MLIHHISVQTKMCIHIFFPFFIYTFILLILQLHFHLIGIHKQFDVVIFTHISGGPKKVAQLLVGHNFKTSCKNFIKLHTTFLQHVFYHFVNFQSEWTTKVEMTVALVLGDEKSILQIPAKLDVYGMHSVWYSAEVKKCQVCLWY